MMVRKIVGWSVLMTLGTLVMWLHVIAFSVWIGGMTFFLFVFAPSVHQLNPGEGFRVLNFGRERFEIVSWIAILLLLATGIGNFFFHGSTYEFRFPRETVGILGMKLFIFLAMLLHQVFQTLKYGPAIVSLSAQAAGETSAWPEFLLAPWRKWFILLKINAALGLIGLILGVFLGKG